MGWLHVGFSSVLSADFLRAQADAFAVTRVLLAIWAALSSLEWLASLDLFATGGLLCRRELPLRLKGIRFEGRTWDTLFSARGVAGLLALRLLAAICLATVPGLPAALASLVALVGIYGLFLFVFGEQWYDGADKMGMVVSLGALLLGMGLLRGDPLLSASGTLWIGGHLTISYIASGACKLFVPEWRSGTALVGVFDTHIWGRGLPAAIVDGPGIALILSWGLMLGEALFPLALVAPRPVLVVVLAGFLIFHVATGLVMGLNLFVWAFVAAYPSVIMLSRMLRLALGWSV